MASCWDLEPALSLSHVIMHSFFIPNALLLPLGKGDML